MPVFIKSPTGKLLEVKASNFHEILEIVSGFDADICN